MKNQTSPKAYASKSEKTLDPKISVVQHSQVDELSAKREPLQLSPSKFIKIDHATLFDNIAVITGWASATVTMEIENTIKVNVSARPDADKEVQHPTVGFIAVVAIESGQLTITCIIDKGDVTMPEVRIPIRFSTDVEEITLSMRSFLHHSNELLPYFAKSRLLSIYLSQNCLHLSPAQRENKRAGHLDIVKTFPEFGYIAYGWAINRGLTDFWLVSEDGHWHSLCDSIRFNRPDVSDAFAESFGAYTAEAGFHCVVKNPLIENSPSVRLVAAIDNGLYVIHQIASSIGPQTPISYARWAFSLSTPASKFFTRLNKHEGDLIEHLITQDRRGHPASYDVWEAGAIPTSPKTSIIIPLYSRSDFVEYQLTQFARDSEFKDGSIEIIYVVDDPTLVESMLNSYHELFKVYRIPFQIIWGKVNRGYSGANNLGLKIARGDTIILLNSDVFPIHAGWAGQMSEELLSDESIGAVGARLEFSDGSVQHQGMAFEYSDNLGVWLNEHPMRGLDVPVRTEAYDVEAATGACLAIRRSDLSEVGGMDEGFLIGDFEDSDLCLKLRKLRGRIVISAGTRLVHLERQSFINLGSNDFRTNVVKFNAWRHDRKWAKTIIAMKEKFK